MNERILDSWEAISFHLGLIRFETKEPTVFLTEEGWIVGGFIPFYWRAG